MELMSNFMIVLLLIGALGMALAAVLAVLVIRALLKYLRSKDGAPLGTAERKSLGETLKERRGACKLTQEQVASSLGVSRQAVSKWESGAGEPSTANLLALAALYGVSVDELLRTGS